MKLILKLLLISISFSYIIGIDFGSQFIKVAYQPFNRPPDIVPDPSGKRKIDNSIFFGDDVRVFGNNAQGSSTLKPEYVYTGMNELLGQGAESDKPASYQQRNYPYEFVLTDRNTWGLRLLPGSGFPDIPTVTTEELNAMILDYVVSIVENEYGETQRDVVISIPSTFTQQQRQALLDAAKLVNIRVLSMIDRTTASAVTYAMTRAPEGFKHLLLFDIGSHYSEVSAVDIETKKEDGIFKHSLVVLGKETAEYGGDDFTAVICSIIADRFEQKYREDPRRDNKVMARLRISSRKYKEVLSANREVLINEPNLYHDHDIQFILTREEYEEECMTLVDKVVMPLINLLDKVNKNINEFSELQLVGGSSRIPLIKETLHSIVGDFPINANLNGDESAALGCIYYGSGSKYARNKLEGVWDIPSYPVFVTMYRPNMTPQEYYMERQEHDDDYITSHNGKLPSFPIFSGQNSYDKESSISFPVYSDFRVQLHYQPDPYHHSSSNIVSMINEYVISDITKYIKSIDNLIESNVTLVFTMDKMGMIALTKAELTSKYISQEDRIAYQRRYMSPFYRYGRGDPMANLRGRTRTDVLKITPVVDNLQILPMTKPEIKASKRKLKEMRYRDDKTKNDQKLLNEYESLMYDSEITMDEEDFMSHTTSDERKWLTEQLDILHDYIQKCHSKEILFKKGVIQDNVNDIQSFMNKVDKRIMDDLDSEL